MNPEKELRDALELLRRWWRLPDNKPVKRAPLQRDTYLFLQRYGGILGETQTTTPGAGLCNPAAVLKQGDALLTQKLVSKGSSARGSRAGGMRKKERDDDEED